MANRFQYVRGVIKEVALPTYTDDTVEVGDLMYWDSTNGAARPAITVGGSTYGEQRGNLAATFLGVAMSGKVAGAKTPVLIATDGDFVFATQTGTDYNVCDGVSGGDGTTMRNQTVFKDNTSLYQIGRVVAPKTASQAYVTVRLLSKLNK